jgi:hypothetical protein
MAIWYILWPFWYICPVFGIFGIFGIFWYIYPVFGMLCQGKNLAILLTFLVPVGLYFHSTSAM